MKKRIALLVAMVLIISAAHIPVSAKSDRLENFEHKIVDFASIEYEHIDGQEIEAKLEKLGEICENEKNLDEVRKLVLWLEEITTKFDTMTYIGYYNFLINPTDEYWSEESQYSSVCFEKIKAEYLEVLKKLIVSPCKAALNDIYSEEEMEGILLMAAATEEQLAASEKNTELYNEYIRLVNEGCEVEYQGKKYTLQSLMTDYTAGKITDVVANAVYQTILDKTDLAIADVYLQMININNSYAKERGYDNYLDYAYKNVFFREFSSKDAMMICENLRKLLGPSGPFFNEYESGWLLNRSSEYTREGEADLLERIMDKMEPEYKESFDYMKETNSLRIFDEGGLPNPLTSRLAEYNMPFICMVRCASGIEDMENLFHEFGHYNAFYWSAPSTSLNQSNDFDEVFSQAMSLLATNYYDEIYEEAAKSAEKWVLGVILNRVYFGCCQTEWEYTAYTGEFKSAEELINALNEVGKKYFSVAIGQKWYNIGQFFQLPGYVLSYPISAMSALELYEISKEDLSLAQDKYLELLSNQALPMKEALSKSGLTANWTEKKIKKLFSDILTLYVDKEAPVICGVEDGGYYTDVVSVDVQDTAGLNISLSNNGESQALSVRSFDLGGAIGDYTITVTDSFGNASTATFEVVPHPFTVTVTGGKKGAQALTWSKAANVTYYKVYGAPLGEKFELLGTVDSSDRRFVNKNAGKKVWKYYVVAGVEYEGQEYDLYKSLRSFGVSLKSKKYTNAANIEINEGESLSLEKGQAKVISITETLGDETKKQFTSKKIKTVKYVSSNVGVAEVSKKGKITAVAEGECVIYAISENGLIDMIKVDVG